MQNGKSSKNSQRIGLKHKVPQQTGAILNCRTERTSLLIKDGTVASFDMRTNQPIFRKTLHKGAVNSLKVVE